MLSDPQSITIGATTSSLAKVESDRLASRYANLADGVEVTVSQSNGKRYRTLVKATKSKIAADPLTAVNQRVTASAHLVLDRPIDGFTSTEVTDLIKGLVGWLSASTYSATGKIVNGEF